jgi:hypothetical protein
MKYIIFSTLNVKTLFDYLSDGDLIVRVFDEISNKEIYIEESEFIWANRSHNFVHDYVCARVFKYNTLGFYKKIHISKSIEDKLIREYPEYFI